MQLRVLLVQAGLFVVYRQLVFWCSSSKMKVGFLKINFTKIADFEQSNIILHELL